MNKIKVIVASNNKGKIKEIKRFASKYTVSILSPEEAGIPNLHVDESGNTFKENAELKLKAYLRYVKDNDIWVVADDSGIEIPALNNEPGVKTRRWAGYKMTDKEILDYCLDRMRGFKDDERVAIFRTVLAAGKKDTKVEHFGGEMRGKILEEPKMLVNPVQGFPFRTVFYIPTLNKMIYELQDKALSGSQKFKTHREIAFDNFLGTIKK